MKILLINPYPADRPPLSPWPHLGLSIPAPMHFAYFELAEASVSFSQPNACSFVGG
jgi:hypothetical protein